MLKYTLILLVGAVMAQSMNSTSYNSTMKYNSTNLNSTAPMQYHMLPPCSISMTCDQVLKMNGNSTAGGSACYEIFLQNVPYKASSSQTNVANMFKLPSSWESKMPQQQTRCMTQQTLESGFGGMFGYQPEREWMDKYGYKNYQNQGWNLTSTQKGTKAVQFSINQVSYSQKQYENGQLMSDHYSSDVMIGKSRISTMTQKIQDYLYFSMLQGDVNANSTDIGNCAQSCGKGAFVQKCCAAINMMSERQTGEYTYTKTKEFTYMCVDQAVAPGANVNMNVGDMKVTISCVGSGAQKLTMVVVSALAALFTLV